MPTIVAAIDPPKTISTITKSRMGAITLRPRFEPHRVADQFAQPALGEAEIPRESQRRAGLTVNHADMDLEARRQITPLDDKGSFHALPATRHAGPAPQARRGHTPNGQY
jgi:hypothetical protein